MRQLLRLRQLLRRVPGQRRDQARPAGPLPIRDRPRFLQGLRPVRRRVPCRSDRDDTRGDLNMRAPAATKWIYDFAEGSREMRELLGGKGSGIAEMTRVLGP